MQKRSQQLMLLNNKKVNIRKLLLFFYLIDVMGAYVFPLLSSVLKLHKEFIDCHTIS